ncbi:ras-associated and pleckstrin homology domains-containing protein 1-like [Aquila chrysaetos chrysaetos]|uniref:ras-associated and pleckstrin homology domains-containing protein 1-like n=1 Tax=Aquila chrysaetos chrysaetos TaxID=223781 RepID=UPI001176713E|nr:ras-associated and pleckstrin homology domains-containing protein 1-like [Aquila chrysaetos chrysaetos]
MGGGAGATPCTRRHGGLEGCTVPLDGCGQLQPPRDGDGDKRLYRLRGVPGGASSTLLLAPDSPTGPLTCAPPLHGCLTITESFGPPPSVPVTVPVPNPLPAKRKMMIMMETLEAPEVSTPERVAPGEGRDRRPGPPPDVGVAPEEPEVPKKKKQQHKGEQLE